MTKPRSHLRTRLIVAMVAIAVGVLVFSGLSTLILTRRAAIASTERDLEEKAPIVARAAVNLVAQAEVQNARAPTTRARSRVRADIARVLGVAGASVVTVRPDGQVDDGLVALATACVPPPTASPVVRLPHGITASDLDVAALQAGQQQTATKGQLVFVAQPIGRTRCGTPVVVLTGRVEQSLPNRAGAFFLLAAVVAIGVAALVAYFIARRMTRQVAAIGAAAGQIADGDLAARVDPGSHPPDELAELADTLNAMAAQLEAARGAERTFLLSVSHDLRTPLTSIKGYAEAMTDGTLEAPEDRKRAAEVISAEARRLERLVADLLDLARLDAHQFSFSPRPFDAAEMVENAVAAFRPSAAELGIALRVDTAGAIPAEGDPERIGQIVANLVENALKYASAAITAGAAPDAGWLRLSVQDDGAGIDPADIPQVFDRLYTSRTTPGRKVGTGLGLAIVRELSAAMGGRAAAERLDSGGTRFTVHLPVLARPL